MIELVATIAPGTTWSHLEAPLVPSVWVWRLPAQGGITPTEQQFLEVLSTLTNLWIRADDFVPSAYDESYLDNVRMVAPPCASAAILCLRRTNSIQLTLEWPTNACDFQLEATDSLSAPNWTTNVAATASSVTNGLNLAIVSSTNGNRFYRLSKLPPAQ